MLDVIGVLNNEDDYSKNGYKEFARKAVDGDLEFVYMEKKNGIL